MVDSPSQTPRSDFGDPDAEYRAARSGAALFDLVDWTQIDLAGRDRAKFLHNFCTNDIRALAVGTGCEAFITNVQGKVLAHVFVYAGQTALNLIAVPECAAPIIKHLSRYQISEDVAFSDLTRERCLILVAGPQAASVLEATGVPVTAAVRADKQQHEVAASPLETIVMPSALLEVPGYLVACKTAEAAICRSQLVAAGAVPAGTTAFEALRIESGFPFYGIDMTDANLAQEVGRTVQAISFSKGCYLGQEPIARIDALGHVNQQLRGLRLEAGPLPPMGAVITTNEDEPRKIGHVTSAAFSYGIQAPVALGYLKRHYDTPDLDVSVVVDGNAVPARLFWPQLVP